METNTYFPRLIDAHLLSWAKQEKHKPLLLRGARQVGKSSAIVHLAKQFQYFIDIDFQKDIDVRQVFAGNININTICTNLSSIYSTPIVDGQTLLFLDEIQDCPEAIHALRYFKEDRPDLHVVAAGSLLEFALAELPSFGVGRIQSMYMYPFCFEEFMLAQGEQIIINNLQNKNDFEPLHIAIHNKLVDQLRIFMLIGGMPDVVATWVEQHDYLACQQVQADLLRTYGDDFAKYKRRISPLLLQQTLIQVARGAGQKFVYADVVGGNTMQVKEALELLSMAGLIIASTHTAGNGLPLGADINPKFRKFLLLDTGLMLRMLDLPLKDFILASDTDLVCKGPLAEVFAGLEILKHLYPLQAQQLYYWQNLKHNAIAEVDYIIGREGQIVPIEVKAGTKGSMQSMYYFLQIKNLPYGIRTSLENFGEMEKVKIIPLYAIGKALE